MTGFCLFENFHQKKHIGSSRIRGRWVMQKMRDAEEFVQGKDYDSVVYQKTYWREHARMFHGKKVLDICDPDWLDGVELVSFVKNVDAITVPTVPLKTDIERMTDKPVFLIPDRILFDGFPERKKHFGTAKKVGWFGYSHNVSTLDPALVKIKKMGLTLVVISNANLQSTECEIENISWSEETVYKNLQTVDFVLLPDYLKGRGVYKSQNKTELSWALGLPVAKTPQDMDRFMDGLERENESKEKSSWARKECDVTKSAEEMQAVLDSIQKV